LPPTSCGAHRAPASDSTCPERRTRRQSGFGRTGDSILNNRQLAPEAHPPLAETTYNRQHMQDEEAPCPLKGVPRR
jgi:hypothetical protein